MSKPTRSSLQLRLDALVLHRTRAQARGDTATYKALDERIRQVHAEIQALDDTIGETLREGQWRQLMHRGRKG